MGTNGQLNGFMCTKSCVWKIIIYEGLSRFRLLIEFLNLIPNLIFWKYEKTSDYMLVKSFYLWFTFMQKNNF